jgi:hypothetical protein
MHRCSARTKPRTRDAKRRPCVQRIGPVESSETSVSSVEGAAVHFAADSDLVEAVIDKDTPTGRSFVAMLPMTLRFSDYGGKEKVAAPSPALRLHAGRRDETGGG